MNLSAPPSARALTSSELLHTLGRAQPAATIVAARASGPADLPRPQVSLGPGVRLVAAAALTWGPSDLRAKTIERASLQLPALEVSAGGESERSVWRRPATVTSIVLTLIAVAVGIVLLVR